MPYRKYMKPRTKSYAKYLRWHPTASEELLWNHINGHKLGYRCRRQEPILGYIADFYFAKKRLVVELDGSYHTHRHELDAERDAAFLRYNLRTLRIQSSRVFHDLEGVLEDITQVLEGR